MAKRGDPNIRDIGHATRFPSPNQNKKGAPKKIYTILKEKGYKNIDINTAFGEISFYNIKELEKVIEDESLPIIVLITAKQFLEAFRNSDYSKISDILKHTIGLPKQTTEIKGEIAGMMPTTFYVGDKKEEKDKK